MAETEVQEPKCVKGKTRALGNFCDCFDNRIFDRIYPDVDEGK